MEVQNNAAGRLLAILEDAKGSHHNEALRTVWARCLGCQPSETAELLRLWGELIGLANNARAAVAAVENINESLFLQPFNVINKALTKVNFDRPWHEVNSILDENTMIGLRYADDLLRREGGSQLVIQDAQISDLMSELDRILNRVLESDLPPKLKKLFATNLEQLRQALVSIRISGAEGLEQEVDRVFGSALRNSSAIKDAANAGEDSASVVRDYFGILTKFNDTVTFGQNVAVLATPSIPLLAHLLAP